VITEDLLPDNALLQKYAKAGVYTDCFSTEVPGTVSLAEFVEAFYTTWLFKLERFILRVAVSRPSTDEQVKALTAGTLDTFAAWYVEGREENQLLMCDFRDHTRSWFMVAPGKLYFGSAVVPMDRPSYKILIGLHRFYSRALLSAARSQLQ